MKDCERTEAAWPSLVVTFSVKICCILFHSSVAEGNSLDLTGRAA
jgi:hypothetical protein